jgi:hypothetical protein
MKEIQSYELAADLSGVFQRPVLARAKNSTKYWLN